MAQVTWNTQEEVAAEALTNWRESASVSPLQAKIALARFGKSGEVRKLLSALGEDDELVIAWENATAFRRNSPTILGLAKQLGLDDNQLDELFEAAENVSK